MVIIPNKILLKLNFKHEGHLFLNCLFYIMTIFGKYLSIQFSGCGIRIQILIRTEAQNWRLICQKGALTLIKKFLFVLMLISQDEGHLYDHCFLIFRIFILNAFLFSSYAHSHPNRGFERATKVFKEIVIFL